MLTGALLDLFHEYNARTWDDDTKKFYKDRLKLFRAEFSGREFRLRQKGEPDTVGISKLEIDVYLHKAGHRSDGTQWSSSTRRGNVVALQRFHNFCLEFDLIEAPVWTKKLPKPPIGKRDRIPTEDETKQLLKDASPAFKRIYQALRIAGARPGEFCRAEISEWKQAEQVIVLEEHKTKGKTGLNRRIPVSLKLAAILRIAVGSRTEGAIFLSPQKQPWTPQNLSATYRRNRDEAGLPDDLVLYLARHECGTRLTRSKGLEYARRVLGHQHIATTTRYSHLPEDDLRSAMDEVS